jgi:hypothetical protein
MYLWRIYLNFHRCVYAYELTIGTFVKQSNLTSGCLKNEQGKKEELMSTWWYLCTTLRFIPGLSPATLAVCAGA